MKRVLLTALRYTQPCRDRALPCLDFTGPRRTQRQLSGAFRALGSRHSQPRPCPETSTGRECSQGDLAGYKARRQYFERLRRITGRSTNGRSSAFGALCLGSNPSRPTKKSTPDARSNLGFFGGNNMPQELNEFGFHGSRMKKQWRVNEEVRSLMDRSLSLLQYSQQDVQEVRCRNKAPVRQMQQELPRSTSLEGFT